MWSSCVTDEFQLGTCGERWPSQAGCSCCGCVGRNSSCKERASFRVLLQICLTRNDYSSYTSDLIFFLD